MNYAISMNYMIGTKKNALCFLWYNTCFGIEPFSRLFARWTLYLMSDLLTDEYLLIDLNLFLLYFSFRCSLFGG